MYLTNRHIEERTVRIFHTSRGSPSSFHLLAVDLDVLSENHDALVLYMSILWDKQATIRWKDKRFNAALLWLQERGVMHPATAVRYERSEKTDGSNQTRSESVRDKLSV